MSEKIGSAGRSYEPPPIGGRNLQLSGRPVKICENLIFLVFYLCNEGCCIPIRAAFRLRISGASPLIPAVARQRLEQRIDAVQHRDKGFN